MAIYQPLKPQPTDNLNASQKDLQNNFLQANTIMAIDHYPFDDVTANQGYHKVIHQTPFSTLLTNPPKNYPATPPATIGGIGQIYTAQTNDGVNSDETLYYLTGGGRNIQLTMNFTPSITYNGYTFLPGGLILQYGFVNRTTQGGGTVNFNIPFPSAVIAMWGSGYYFASTPSGGSSVQFKTDHTAATSKTNFDYWFNTSSGAFTGFQWFAIGN